MQTKALASDRAAGSDPVRLPGILHGSRKREIEDLFSQLAIRSSVILDGSKVEVLDSTGLECLVHGVEVLARKGVFVEIVSPSPTLLAARRILELEQRLPVAAADEDESSPLKAHLIGEILIELGYLGRKQLDDALNKAQARPDCYLGQVLLEEGYLSERELAIGLARQHGRPFAEPVRQRLLDVTLEHGVDLADLRTAGALPLLRVGDCLAVAVCDPTDVFAADGIRRATRLQVITSVTTPTEIQAGLDLLQRASGTLGASSNQVLSAAERLEEVLLNALIDGASDIHLEAQETSWLLRYRVDGRLHDVAHCSPEEGRELTARIKVLAGCDISERRLPQDGRMRFQQGSRDVDLRVNTMPTVHGEKTVMRILDRTAHHLSLEEIGLHGRNLEWMREAIDSPHGLVLVTGPTGSGKTTTLYSVLEELVGPEINIATVENPVERTLRGVNQTQVNFKAGLDFGKCLRALLRQDPDVIMVGEIRDQETARIAVEAALTGHLVLATLHTNDAPGAATRLIQMGVEPFLVSATLRAVMAQRLTRRLCNSCKKRQTLPREILEHYAAQGLSAGPHYSACGCAACRQTGYSGRLGVFEVMKVDLDLQEAVARNPSTAELRRLAVESGMVPLLSDALRRVNDGSTTLEEALRSGGGE